MERNSEIRRLESKSFHSRIVDGKSFTLIMETLCTFLVVYDALQRNFI